VSGGFDRRGRDSAGGSTSASDAAKGLAPGKVTLVEALQRTTHDFAAARVQRSAAGQEAAAPEVAAEAVTGSGGAPPHRVKISIDQLFGRDAGTAPVQRSADRPDAVQGPAVPEVAAKGVAGSGSELPHRPTIQPLFGRHDVSGIRAHVGGEAATASRAIGAEAYATGNDVAFAGAPSLHTTAHEAAHVVQQRGGVQLKGGVGEAGDPHERDADQVADAVVSGRSAEPLLDRYASASKSVSDTAVQMQQDHQHPPAAPAAASGPQVDDPVPGDNKPGFIDNDDGANIRNRPAELAGSKALIDTPLPPATRVFVSGRHPQTAGWWYVTATLSGATVRGYVQGLRVTTDLPELTAKLYQVKSGDTAEGLAVKEFSSAVRDGHDLRFYENVLLFVNRQHSRAGVRGTYQEPGLIGGNANNVQLEAGRRIWLVSPAYARALEGVVPDGSLTNGSAAKVKRFAGHVEDLLKSVDDFPKHIPEVAGEYGQAIHDHAAAIIGITAGFLMAEAASMALAATPGGQLPAIMIQLGLSAFGAHGMAVATVEALKHAARWLELAWNAHGREDGIAAASREFVKMLVSIAMATLAVMGVKANVGKAVGIATDSMPALMPAWAVASGDAPSEAGTATAVAAGGPRPYAPVATAMAMSAKDSDARSADELADSGRKDSKTKSRGQPEDQLSGVGRTSPSSLSPAELARVEAYQATRNEFLKKWRGFDARELPPETQALVRGKADRSIANSMTPDDLAAVIKERRGDIISKADGHPFDHLTEFKQARRSVTNTMDKIRDRMQTLGDNAAAEHQALEQKLGDLSRLLDEYEAAAGGTP
jgi:hypothetical protein